MPKPKVALILGAGFSREANLPTTTQVAEQFLQIPEGTVLTPRIEAEIGRHLTEFWMYVFGHSSGRVESPSLEDHFTVLDVAANSGHHLGRRYDPRRLRAIRRLSIHRIFQILDRRGRSNEIEQLLRGLDEHSDFTTVSTNWDIVVENHLRNVGLDFRYGGVSVASRSPGPKARKAHILKLHGSSNLIYCDLCRTLFKIRGEGGKVALRERVFIREEDFRALGSSELVCQDIRKPGDRFGELPPVWQQGEREGGHLQLSKGCEATAVSGDLA